MAVATGRYFGCGLSLTDAVQFMKRNDLYDERIVAVIRSNPRIVRSR